MVKTHLPAESFWGRAGQGTFAVPPGDPNCEGQFLHKVQDSSVKILSQSNVSDKALAVGGLHGRGMRAYRWWLRVSAKAPAVGASCGGHRRTPLCNPVKPPPPEGGTTNRCRRTLQVALLLLLFTLLSTCHAWASERVEVLRDDEELVLLGDVVAEDEDGNILLQLQTQRIWPLAPSDIQARTKLPESLPSLSKQALAERILQELPAGFRVHTTANYVVCYNTTTPYAQWCGSLFERLHRAFFNYWKRRRLVLQETPPLVACVFRDRASYEAYGQEELGDSIKSILGHYSYETNRIAMYDLLGRHGPGSAKQISQVLGRQERTVATLIHEATHQIAFNCGLHQRYADIPVWLSEGLAIYFETPDLRSSRGWSTIGAVNHFRLDQFRKYAPHRTEESLQTLIASNDRFYSSGGTAAYAESWAFCYFLMRNRSEQFANYLRILQAKPPMHTDSPAQRLQDFQQAFDVLPKELNDEFQRKLNRTK